MKWFQNPILGTISDHAPREIILWNIYHYIYCLTMDLPSLSYAVRTKKLNKKEDILDMHYYADKVILDLDIANKYVEILNNYDRGSHNMNSESGKQ